MKTNMRKKAKEIITTFYNLINSPDFNDKFIDEIEWGYPDDTRNQIKERFKDITIWGDDFVSIVANELESPGDENIQKFGDILSIRGEDLHHNLTYIVDKEKFEGLINIMNHETNSTHNIFGTRIYLVKDDDFHGDYYVEAFLDMDYNLLAFGFGD